MTNGFLLLRDLLRLTRDGEWGKSEPDDNLVKMAVIRGTDFEDVRYGELSNLPVRFIKQAAADYKVLQVGDILIETAGGSKDRPTGRTVFINERILHNCNSPIICASFCRFLRVKRELAEPEYVFWYLQHLYNIGITANYQVQHTGIARFQYTVFAESIEIPLPPLDEQRAIAHILGSLDDKIEANRRLNETLEATARAIFKSWFVDFDPVHTKARGEHPPGMDAATAALFPDSFEESALGPIPRGWGVGGLDEAVRIIGGGTPKTSTPEYWDGDILWFSVKDVPSDTDVFVIDTEKRITQAGVDNSSARLLPQLTTIISARGTVGKLALTGVEMAMNQSCYAIGGSGYPAFFTYFNLKTRIAELQQQTHGTVFDTITRNTFSNLETILPSSQIAQCYDDFIAPILERIRNNVLESRTLAETRDALLPRLVSGEVRVPHP